MEYLQYKESGKSIKSIMLEVLNLIINGIPSIQIEKAVDDVPFLVLNLIINGIPSILIMITIMMH